MFLVSCVAGSLLMIASASCVSATAQQPTASSPAPLQVAFTFDDLPAHGPLPPHVNRPDVVKSILATLQRENMPPTYGFVNGFRVAHYPYQAKILKAWLASGNPLGNHTWSHPELDKLSAAAFQRDIARNEPMLERLDPHGDWRWFRYPFLEEGDTVEKREAVRDWLEQHGYKIAEVSMDFQDYNWNDAYARCAVKKNSAAIASLHDSYLASADEAIRVYRELASKLYDRDVPYVLLMHVGAFDAKMLPELIALFRTRGFGFVTLEQAMSDPIYRTDPKVPAPGGNTFNELVAASRGVEAPSITDRSSELEAMCK